MKKILTTMAASFIIATSTAFAHHMADEIVDEDVYEMIDDIVADTPHADMTVEDTGTGTQTVTISTRTVTETNNMVDDGLLDYASMLDGSVSVNITFDESGTTTTTISQSLIQ